MDKKSCWFIITVLLRGIIGNKTGTKLFKKNAENFYIHSIKMKVKVSNEFSTRHFVKLQGYPGLFATKNSKTISEILKILKTLSLKTSFSVWAYCFMPDYLQMLLMGRGGKNNISDFIIAFMNQSQNKLMNHPKVKDRLWSGKWVHLLLGQNDSTLAVARFIFNAPVRQGLVKNPIDYPFSGSFELNLKNFFD